ncbi:hypothetical protein HDU92_004394, partial [Lobulomyces angularis]
MLELNNNQDHLPTYQLYHQSPLEQFLQCTEQLLEIPFHTIPSINNPTSLPQLFLSSPPQFDFNINSTLPLYNSLPKPLHSPQQIRFQNKLLNCQYQFSCPLCCSVFKRSHDLKRHAKKHLNIRPYVCTGCFKGFTRSDALKNHTNDKGQCKFLFDRRKTENK